MNDFGHENRCSMVNQGELANEQDIIIKMPVWHAIIVSRHKIISALNEGATLHIRYKPLVIWSYSTHSLEYMIKFIYFKRID